MQRGGSRLSCALTASASQQMSALGTRLCVWYGGLTLDQLPFKITRHYFTWFPPTNWMALLSNHHSQNPLQSTAATWPTDVKCGVHIINFYFPRSVLMEHLTHCKIGIDVSLVINYKLIGGVLMLDNPLSEQVNISILNSKLLFSFAKRPKRIFKKGIFVNNEYSVLYIVIVNCSCTSLKLILFTCWAAPIPIAGALN